MKTVGKVVAAALLCVIFGGAGGAAGVYLMADQLKGEPGTAGDRGPRGPRGPIGPQGLAGQSAGLDGLVGAYVVGGYAGCPSGTTTAVGNVVLTDVQVQQLGIDNPILDVFKDTMQLCAIAP